MAIKYLILIIFFSILPPSKKKRKKKVILILNSLTKSMKQFLSNYDKTGVHWSTAL